MNVAIILAAGNGTRLSNNIKKQFIKIHDKQLFLFSFDSFCSSNIDKILIVSSKEDINYVRSLVSSNEKFLDVIAGGETRQQSVRNALDYLKNILADDDVILIHDAARPLIKVPLINEVLNKTIEYDCCSLILPIKDTIISLSNNNYESTLERDKLASVQTPQGFKFKIIYEAHQKAIHSSATDDAQLVKSLGLNIHLIKGDEQNFKITTNEDLNYFEYILGCDDYGRK
ncbi:MAG: 2-C-methyl-D-erythritol 4-phosphate cytidylyltransferase [Bacilli bacterium]|nr:2-C-methyl-D-erythritol 4-phosphate cytidylyltransferase [Bacilli bacterium]